jgi:ABC-type nitrate/sulfonate/bicarbonate transport system permease component
MKKVTSFFKPLIVPILLLGLWELISRNHGILNAIYGLCGYPKEKIPDFSFISPISSILSSLWAMLQTKEFYSYLGDTFSVLCSAFILALILGITIGSIIGLHKRLEKYLFSTIDALRSTPPIVLLPLFILFLGIDNQMKIAFVLFGSVWPVLINTFFAIRDIDPIYLKVAKNLQLSKSNTLFKVIYPLASPAIFTGIKISLSLCLILTIVCEMLIGNKGVGFLINVSKRNGDYDAMFAGILVVAILGWLINKIFKYADQHFLKWYYQKQQ